MSSPLFSIIVSGYQNEPFLPQCLASISSQTFGDFEAICYVEESTDNSLAICQEWAKRDSRFIVATGPKSGAVSTTRNYGIDHAKGEYLVVVDGDDWIDKEMLEKLAAKLKETGPLDILAFAARQLSHYEKNNNTVEPNDFSNFKESDAIPLQIFSGLEAFQRMQTKCDASIHCQSWLNIYRISFLRENHLRQRDGMAGQDVECFPRFFFAAQRVSYLNKCIYYYRINSNSITHTQNARCVLDIVRHFHSLAEFLATHSVPENIQCIWSNQWLWNFYMQSFTWGLLSQEQRKAVLKIFFSTQPKMPFRRFLLNAPWRRILPLPLLWLASKGWHFPANLYFYCIMVKFKLMCQLSRWKRR